MNVTLHDCLLISDMYINDMNKQMYDIISTGFDQGFENQLQVFAPGCHNLE